MTKTTATESTRNPEHHEASRRWRVAIGATAAALIATTVGVVAIDAAADTGRPHLSPVERQIAGDLTAIANWSRAEGLSGLSPASLQPIAADSAIADWARAEGLSGLSPASLHPVD